MTHDQNLLNLHNPTFQTLDADLLNQSSPDPRPTHTRIRIRIPKDYHQEPIISRLISEHGLTVNITAALLGGNAQGDGWFDLELRGTAQQIQSGLIYVDELDLEVWHEATEEDGW